VLSGRSLCEELITLPEESYRLCSVVVCDLENLKNEEAMSRVGSQRHSTKKCNTNGIDRSTLPGIKVLFVIICYLVHAYHIYFPPVPVAARSKA